MVLLFCQADIIKFKGIVMPNAVTGVNNNTLSLFNCFDYTCVQAYNVHYMMIMDNYLHS